MVDLWKSLLIVSILLVGCQTLTPYERAARYDEMVDVYTIASASCEKAGGAMYIRKYTMSHIPRALTYNEMRSAQCVDPKKIIRGLF
ncbi:MAG: hypothetical protein V3V74_04650 [Nitrosomonadaceae bacterium]